MYVIVLRTKGVSDLLKMNVRSWRLFGVICTSTLTFRLECLISRNNPALLIGLYLWCNDGKEEKAIRNFIHAVKFVRTGSFLFPCRPIQHDSLRSFGSNRQYFCSPADRYYTTRCGHLVPTDSCNHCFPVGCVLICLHTGTVWPTAVSVFQPDVLTRLQTDTARLDATSLFYPSVLWFGISRHVKRVCHALPH